jgi:hypothetical protein
MARHLTVRMVPVTGFDYPSGETGSIEPTFLI